MARRSTILNVAEGAGLVLTYGFFRVLPVDWASAIGGFLARLIGPRLGITKRAEENLKRALPHLTPAERRQVIAGMWDNLGRVIAEYPHLDKFRLFEKNSRIEGIDGGNILATRDPAKKYIFFSAHYGNWEIAIRTAAQAGFEVTGVYRAPNNPIVDRFMLWGRDAMTAPALAVLALRYDCAVVPIRMQRLKGARFRMISEPAMALPKTGNNDADRRALMIEVNAIVERWVREHPEQWLWLHRRWPD